VKQKIGEAECPDCGFKNCDVGLDKKQHPYRVCWGDECGGSQFFTHGRKPRVRSLLSTYRPLDGKPTADELRAKYDLLPAAPKPAAKPAPVVAVVKASKDTPPVQRKGWFGATVLDDDRSST
jgi:hypothetical protein